MKLILLTLCLVLLLSLKESDSCSPPIGWKPPSVPEILGWHEELILATVRRKINTLDGVPYRWSSLFTAEVEIQCILRGDRKPVLFNVTYAGYEPGMCYGTNVEVGKSYIIGLMDGDRASAPAIKSDYFAEAFTACNLNPPTYPIGLSEKTADFVCPAGKPAGKCQKSFRRNQLMSIFKRK